MLQLASQLNNQQGEILSTGDIHIKGEALRLNNQEGRLQAQGELSVQAQHLSGDGHLEARDIQLKLQDSFHNQQAINALNNISIQTQGEIYNENKIAANQGLHLQAQSLENARTGRISSAETRLEVKEDVLNRGLINSFNDTDDAKTVIKAQRIDNLGSGRIYGDKVALQAEQINNQDELVDGKPVSATIAARQQLVLAAEEIENSTEHYDADTKAGATLFSGGDIIFGQHLNADDEAEGDATSLKNKSSIIEAAGNILLNVLDTQNTNEHFSTIMEEKPEEGGKVDQEYMLMNFDRGGSINQGAKIKMDRLKRVRPEGKKVRDTYNLDWNRDLDRKLEAEELEAGYVPESNKMVCMYSDPSVCYVKPSTVYDGNYQIWQRFNIEVPKDAPVLGELPTIGKEPHKPRQISKRQLRNPERKAQYEAELAAYYENLSAYKAQIAAYNQALKPYLDWVEKNKDSFTQLNQAIQAQNNAAGGNYNGYWRMYVHENKVIRETVATSLPGQILAGGDIVAGGHSVLNDKSTLIAGGALQIENDKLQNLDHKGMLEEHLLGDSQYMHHIWKNRIKGRRWYNSDLYTNQDRVEKRSFDMNIYSAKANSAHDQITRVEVVNNDVNRSALKTVENHGALAGQQDIEVRSIQADTRLPNQSLYQLNPAPDSHVLVETDPQFADRKKWLSSDYMYRQLRAEHDVVLKRLGDGYYEQRLVRDQINRLTGRQFLGNYQDFQTQYKALMDAGVTFAKKFNLSPGVSLSAEQVASLTSDMVWLESQMVTLPDGSQQQVLVPKVYALANKGDIDGTGTLLSANQVDIHSKALNNEGTIAGRELTRLNLDYLKNSGNLSGDVLSANVSGNVDNLGGSLVAERGLLLHVGGDLRHQSTTQQAQADAQGFHYRSTSLDRKALMHVKSPEGVLSLSAQNIDVNGADIVNEGAGSTLIRARQNLNFGTVNTGFDERMGEGNHYRNSQQQQAVVSHIQTGGNLIMQAHDIRLDGTEAEVAGTLSAFAENDLVLKSAENSNRLEEYHKQERRSIVSSTTTESYSFNAEETKVGSQLSAHEINLLAGQDVKAQGAQIVADKDVNIQAGRDVNISADTNHFKQEHWEKTRTSGMFTGGGIGFTIGSRSEKHQSEAEGWTQSDARGTLGSLDGDVNIQAGNHANVLGSDLITNQAHHLNVTGKSLTVEAGKDLIISDERHEYKQSGLTIALSTPVTDALMAVNNALQRRKQVKNQKLKDVYAVKAGYELGNALGSLNATMDTMKQMPGATENATAAQNPTIKISVSVGSSQSTQTSHTEQLTHSASALNSGQLSLRTTAGDLSIKGSSLNADKMRLSSAHDINLESVQDSYKNRTDSKNSGWNVGVFVGYNGNSYGVGLEASGQVGKGRENTDSLQQRNTYLNANQLELESQNDTNLRGAVVKAERLDANIGHDLNIESRQDSQTYDSKQTQAGGSVSVAWGSGGSASANFSLNKAKMNYAQVEEQSGLQVGKDGMNVNVANNTHLAGGLISSQADTDKNHFSTNTLTSENIENHSEVEVENVSGGFSTSNMAQNAMHAMSSAVSALGNRNESASSTTHSAVGANIQLDVKKPQKSPTLSSLSRDTENANEKVQRFDVAEIKEQQEAAQVVGELAARIVGDVSARLNLEDGSKEKIALHAFAGFLAAKAGDGNALAGAAAGAASEWLNTQVADYLSQHKELTEDERKAIQQASALGIGAIAGALTGGGTEAIKQGAVTSFNAEKFNRQLHPDEITLIRGHAKEYAQQQGISEEEAQQQLAQEALRGVSDDFAGVQENAQARDFLNELQRQEKNKHLFEILDRDSDVYKNSLINSQYIAENQYLYDSVKLGNYASSTSDILFSSGLKESGKYYQQAGKDVALNIFGESERLANYYQEQASRYAENEDSESQALARVYQQKANLLNNSLSSSYPNARGLFSLDELYANDNPYSAVVMRGIAEGMGDGLMLRDLHALKLKVQANSGTCSFRGDMQVKTENGYQAIASLKLGDKVYAKNEITGLTGYQKVLAHYNNPYDYTVYVHIRTAKGTHQTIVSNKIHPFFAQVNGKTAPPQSEGHNYRGDIANAQWVDAQYLQTGDKLLSESGEWQAVEKVEIKAEKLSAYNLTVEQDHTYFIKGTESDAEGVWVHNDCWISLPENAKQVKNIDGHKAYKILDNNNNEVIVIQKADNRFETLDHKAGDPAFNKINQRVNEKTGRYEASDLPPLDGQYGRSLRAATERAIKSNYDVLPNGDYINKISLEVIKAPVDIGHAYGWEHRRLVLAAQELNLTPKEFNDYVNARPGNFKLENMSENRSHKYEKPGRGDIQYIRRDMEKFLKEGK